MIARVRGVTAASTRPRSIVRVDGIDVDEDRPGPDLEDHVARGDPGERGRDHLVPGPTPAIRSAISIVQVPELKARTGRPPK